MALLTPQQARLLEPEGFHEQFSQVLSQPGQTRLTAYNASEALHEYITGGHKYSNFESFDRQARRIEAKQRKSPAN
jgi:hypothetical protein